jgi:hypothetical protein
MERISIRPEDIADFWPTEKLVDIEVTPEQALEYNNESESRRLGVLSQLIEVVVLKKTASNPRGQQVLVSPPTVTKDQIISSLQSIPGMQISGGYTAQLVTKRGNRYMGQVSFPIDIGDQLQTVQTAPAPAPGSDKLDRLIDLMMLKMTQDMTNPPRQENSNNSSIIDTINALAPILRPQQNDAGSMSAVAPLIQTMMSAQAEIKKLQVTSELDIKSDDRAHARTMELKKIEFDHQLALRKVKDQNAALEAANREENPDEGNDGQPFQWDDGSNLKQLAGAIEGFLPIKGGPDLPLTDMMIPLLGQLTENLAHKGLHVVTSDQLQAYADDLLNKGITMGYKQAIEASGKGTLSNGPETHDGAKPSAVEVPDDVPPAKPSGDDAPTE